MNRWVEIVFDCLPLRSVPRLDAPLDASPAFRALCERIKAAIETHGAHNTYYLYNGRCGFHLANSDAVGLVEFRFEGTVFTDPTDLRTDRCELRAELARETCDRLTEPVVEWFKASVAPAVAVEFDRYIRAGDLDKAKERLDRIQHEADARGGFVGMYL